MPKTALTQEQISTDLKLLEPAVDGLYASFRSNKAGRGGLTFSLLGLDESKQGIVQMMDASQAGFDNYDGMLNPTSAQIDELWTRRLPTIHSAALCIAGLDALTKQTADTETETLAKLTDLKAHACFVRALTMFELTMYFGRVPVQEIADLNSPEQDLSLRPLPEVWAQIARDFEYASQNLPLGPQKTDRATKGAALAMLGKTYMYAPEESTYRDFQKAADCFKQVMDLPISPKYNVSTSYSLLFDEWGGVEFDKPESVYEIDYKPNSQGPNFWQWDMGSRTLAALGEPCYIGGYDVALPTEYAYKMQADGGVWEEGDKRREVSIRYDFTYNGKTYDVVAWGADELDPHIKKWEDRRVDKFSTAEQAKEAISGRSFYYSGKNYMMIRFADVLLCYAECLNELGQTAAAVTEVNKVRRRAFEDNAHAWNSAMSQADFRVNILDERLRELCFEGWRRMDLIRTGKFVELISERNPWAKEKGTIRDYHVRFPIPNNEILTNPQISREDQNDGYN
ncbi:membrane protein [Bacteroidia bacterium]|nr:membrane protein [Bacteroidia bacterium]